VRTVADVALLVSQAKIRGQRVSFVPTMGAIHDGHLSLVKIARATSDLVIASIFVNPLQFGSSEDFELYPRTEEHDSKLLEKAGADILFLPTVEEIYPGENFKLTQSAGEIGSLYEGAARPGHFDGMLTVVSRLFDIVQPDIAVFGKKDAQQLFLIKKMLERQNPIGTRDPIQIIEAETIRDPKGLALSSRNKRLKRHDLEVALVLSSALREARELASAGKSPTEALAAASNLLGLAPEAKLDYLALVNPATFQPIEDGFTGEALMIVAAVVGSVRLIDNLTLTF
jgi:pantoate--beta-alanine ligase